MLESIHAPTGDERGLILLRPRVFQLMMAFRQTGPVATEAGGVLIGSLRGPHIEVIDCTQPMQNDLRRSHAFDRRDAGHVAAIHAAMKGSAGTIGYVGEWHTHPEPVPSPSGQDSANWRNLVRQTKHSLAFVILGTDGLFMNSLDERGKGSAGWKLCFPESCNEVLRKNPTINLTP
ncbi:Mov34/MPN/PAD-1 family protein [Magnetospirillum sulfuroxidans]|uniref:Mov34/MPN/PAD-1 family protein n=1 Tax=Magnetospirillum sulfuroxidans TaxID=611300 RepID=A0ABS5I944_9PROT|nr:Mov34/MPN/PAD-1 family protein [Magnetospirillum sulfuroxidans]MBR9970960.1 Mov34/MPN/PAD-1 family protein [Magnetospirillum sulfuroxidans]